ncbi:MAG: hypothetical protein Q4G69_01125 [Planctomycetia bacterium]|nr:hypothetical protein [Planctomycetia bacterium]
MKKTFLTASLFTGFLFLICAGLNAQENFKPKLFAKLAPCLYNPDGLTVCEKTGKIFLNVPNFSQVENGKKKNSNQGGYLVELKEDGSFSILLEYPSLALTGQSGPMGLDIGPDGNIYTCDNQYFYSKDHSSRILRVVMKDGKPTGEVQVAVEGVKLANAVMWFRDRMFYSDSCFDTQDPNAEKWIGSGGVFMFEKEEILKAGKDGNPPLKLKSADVDSHCLATVKVQRVGRSDPTGPDGLTADSNTGVIYFGNFGNGQLYAIYPNADGSYTKNSQQCIYDPAKAGKEIDPPFQCCDGIFFDKVSNKIFINDSVANAIRYFAPVKQGEKAEINVLAINDDTDGNDGSLDQPCECVVVNGKMIIVNFDWPFPGMKNTKVDLPGTLSVIDISSLK